MQVRTDALLHRQYELIECIGWVSEVGRSVADDARAAELINTVRKQIVDGSSSVAEGAGGDDIELLELIGEGSVRTHKF